MSSQGVVEGVSADKATKIILSDLQAKLQEV
jgi:hypothetical protein